MIRFGGVRRLSNFLLWHVAYSEIEFSDMLWPDVRQRDLTRVIYAYQSRTRTFGARG